MGSTAADNTVASTPQISPADPSCRWYIKSRTTNGYDVFT